MIKKNYTIRFTDWYLKQSIENMKMFNKMLKIDIDKGIKDWHRDYMQQFQRGNKMRKKEIKKLVDYFIEKDFGKLKPRNPKRIKRILKLIEELWESKKDMRFGQLLENYVFSYEGGFDMWNQEDDVTEEKLKGVLKSETRNE